MYWLVLLAVSVIQGSLNMSSGLGRVIWTNPLGDGSVRLVPYVCSLHAQQLGLHVNSTCPATQARRTKRDSVLTGSILTR